MRDDHDEGDDPEPGAAVDQAGQDPGPGRHQGPLQVEADDRAPGGVPLVDDPLARLQVHAADPIAVLEGVARPCPYVAWPGWPSPR